MTKELALTLNGKKRKITRKDFEILGESLHIPERACQNSIAKFTLRNHEVNRMIDASFLGLDEKEQYKRIWLNKQAILLS